MITTIIITALVSVFITLVIGYFIWQFISVRKLKKQVKDNTIDIKCHSEWTKNLEDDTYKKFDEVYDNFSRSIEETHSKIDEVLKELNQKIDKKDEEIHRELDKRFDKVYKIFDDLQNKRKIKK